MSIENIDKYGTDISADAKLQFKAEFRFIRAYVYFELVRRMGGVPLITTTLEYDFSGDPSYLRNPRAKEHEIYDFVYSECEDIKSQLGNKAVKAVPTITLHWHWKAVLCCMPVLSLSTTR